MNRRWLLVPAALMAAWIVYGTARWIADGASIARSWQAATADWMTAVFLSDGMAFAAVASIAVLVDLDDDDAITQEGDARQKKANQVHDVLPADLAPSPEILFELLELPQDVTVVGLIDESRQED